MADNDHDLHREDAALYALGALGGEARASFEAHLRGCDSCAAELRALAGVVHLLPVALPQVEPPAALRERILSIPRAMAPRAVAGAERVTVTRTARFSGTWLTAAALLLVCVGLGAYSLSLRERLMILEGQLIDVRGRLSRSEEQVAVATTAAAGMQARLAVLTAPDLAQVTLAGQPPAPGAAGRAFWSRSRGLVFAASDLPALPAGRTYQLWYLTSGAPISAGIFKPDEAGRAALVADAPPAAQIPTGLAVSLEPEGGVPAPTGDIYLAGLSS